MIYKKIVVLSPTLWKLRQAVREVNQTLDGLMLEKHPDKTYIGRIEKSLIFWVITLGRRDWGSPARR